MRLVLLLGFSVISYGATFDEVAALAEAARQGNDIPRAIELYGQAVKLNPAWQQGWWFLGTFLYGSGRYAPAREAYQKVVELNPQIAPGWGLLGLCEFQTAAYGRALEHVQRSLALGAGKEQGIGEVLRYHEAVLLAKEARFETALEKYAPFVRSGPAIDPQLSFALGVAVLRMTLVPGEVPAGEKDLVAQAGRAAGLAMRADAGAGRAFAELLERFPRSRNVHFVYGSHLLAADLQRARAEFEAELALSPNNAAASAMLALIASNRGERGDALRHAEKAVKDDASSSTAQYVLGRVLVEAGQAERGIRYLEAAVRMDPANVENHVELATAYPKAGRYQEATKERRRTLELLKDKDGRP